MHKECPNQNASSATASILCHCEKTSVVYTTYSMGLISYYIKILCITVRILFKIYEHICFHNLKIKANRSFKKDLKIKKFWTQLLLIWTF